MGVGASTKGARSTVHTAVGTVRWRKNAPSSSSSTPNLGQSERETSQAASEKDINAEGRYGYELNLMYTFSYTS